jgi:predicted GNAT family N-acyltransferase
MSLKIIVGNYEKLKNKCNLIRYTVFVREQNVPKDLELDQRDPFCTQLILELNHNPIATGRIDLEKGGKIGRLAVLQEFRNQGYGTIIINQLEAIAKEKGLNSVWLNAQKISLDFYQKLGYQVTGDEFMEVNIIHLKMSKNLSI